MDVSQVLRQMNGKGIAVNLLAVYIGYIELNIGQFNVMGLEEVGKEFLGSYAMDIMDFETLNIRDTDDKANDR